MDPAPIVVEKFQSYLGTPDDLPLTSLLLADLGIDSIALVTILLDLAETLKLDLMSADVQLSEVQTLGDVVDVIGRLTR